MNENKREDPKWEKLFNTPLKNEPRRKQNMSVLVLPNDFLPYLRHFI